MKTANQEPIAVIGMANRFPGGSDSPSKLWDLLRAPRDLSQRVPLSRFDSTGYFHTNGSHHGATDCRNAYFLEEDITRFDNSFFNIQPGEAEAIDPQQRLLMETIYESLCSAGQSIEDLRGSRTAVYVGQMCDDWSQMSTRDWELTPTYSATGQSRAILSNRVSYFFDWHGPSITIDTACSSSLVAVHQGVTALRNGECPVAIAAGVNLILAPGMWIAESKLHMLSPTGTSKMWDAAADGYARGEGVASVILKPLSAALRDGDHIECVIRETGVNQDGRTAGLTMPSNIAQADLIRHTYERAGLDIDDAKDRPQFFHAHGTGTPAGDPQEAEAISSAFFGGSKVNDPLYVGSIKTVIGHTEGTAGLASLIGTSLAMKHGIVPPNLHFNSISPKVAPFCANLQVPTTAIPWPNPIPGQPRRASVNSFGFGGTNAHAIIESYDNDVSKRKATMPAFTPLTVSATSLPALRIMLSDLRDYLNTRSEIDIRDVAYTLQSRRSTFLYRKTVMSETAQEAVQQIDTLLSDASVEKDLASRSVDVSTPSILGVFTGQGAQWPRMAAHLIEKSAYVAERFAELDFALSQLPQADRPDWTLRDQLLADASVSRLSEAALAQPLCTAVQIVLVDLLRIANIHLSAVVGHSSGEIGAAYAAGFLSATDAIRIAYYRGIFAKLACSQSENGIKGAMMAVGTSFEDASEFCAMGDFDGRIQVAARNSSTSVTLSGDEDAIEEALAIFVDEGRFARKLKVDTAYHSHHMKACAGPYLNSLERCNINVGEGNGTKWFSSVVEGQIMSKEIIQPQYWVDNMTSAVLFAPAVASAVAKMSNFDMAVEFGPHPALKGPCLDTIEEMTGSKIPYTGLLSRQKNDVEELGHAIGAVWTQLGARSVDFESFEKAISGVAQPRKLVSDLPAYPFDHSRSFYALSRFSGAHRNVHTAPHPLLGRRCVETETDDEISWRNILRQSEISWLQGHQLQGQMVFPAMGYVSTAVEAAVAMVNPDQKLALINLENIQIGRALTFVDDSVGMEFKVTLKVLRSTDNELHTEISCHSGVLYNSSTPLALNFKTNVTLTFQEPEPETLPVIRMDEVNLVEADPERFYTQFTQLGYNYSPPFTGVRAIHRKSGFATGVLEDLSGDAWEDQLMLHPGWLDCALQTSFAAYSHPLDGRLNLLHVPTAIKSITVNPYFFTTEGRTRQYQYQATTCDNPVTSIEVDVDIFAGIGHTHACVQFESIQARPFAAPGPRDDTFMFSRFEYKLAGPDAVAAVEGDDLLPPANGPIVSTAERMGFFYLRRLHETITAEEKAATLPHFQHLLTFASKVVGLVTSGDHPNVPPEAINDSHAYIRSLAAKYHDRADIRLVEATGENLPAEIRRNGSMLEHMMQDGLLDRLYEESAGLDVGNAWFARTVAQITHRHPRMRLFEIGAGTGGTTRFILPMLDDAFASYTFTDISAGFFERAQDRFNQYADRMSFATYNMERTPADQGFEEGSYDVVFASNVLHATGQLDEMMANVRRLLRPGGYLIALEIISNYFLHIDGIMGGLPGWWAGAAADPRRCDGPCLTLEQWDTLSRQHGFAGVDSHTPMEHKLQSYAVFVCQAVDDRVMSLRDPLAGVALTSQSPSHLVVIGGSTPAVNKLSGDLCELLNPCYTTITRFVSLEEVNTSGLAQGSSVISLTELDQQFLEVRSASKLEALKKLWRHGGTILWVTKGARDEHPYSSIMLGLSRVIRYENPHINLQVLDFDKTPAPSILAEGILRLELGERWKREGVNLLWSVEPEMHYVGDQLLIPRLYPEAKLNARYNTYRRIVHEDVNPQEATVVLESSLDGKALELSTLSPLRILPTDRLHTKTIAIDVEHSLLQMINVSEEGFLSLCAGKNVETGEPLIALTDSAIESRVTVPLEWTVSASVATLGALAAQLLAQSILSTAPRFGTVLVHEADDVLKDTLQREAAKEGTRVVFTTAIKEKRKDNAYLFIHERLPQRLMQRLVPQDISLFVNLAPDTNSAYRLARYLPPNTTTTTGADYLRNRPSSFTSFDIDQIGQSLKAAWQVVLKQRRISSMKQVPIIPLQDVGNIIFNPSLVIADWNTSSVQACVRPIDFGTIFRADGTYLLVGLAGDLGQSLCRWMVAHGARNVVLSSRRPKVDPRFSESLETFGAKVKILSLDITQRDSLRACYDTICAEMPPIIGVANGALILEDTMFDDMEFASMDRQAAPKIDGSVLLDELFYDTPLDFFIMFCSIANISGNMGQSPYIMANQFMTALAAQRRDLRGVSGSVMAISSVQGLGYFEHANRAGIMNFAAKGYRNISEQDVHQQFAEAILAGRPGTRESSEVVTGIIPFRDGENIQPQLRTDPKFRHFMLQDLESNSSSNNGSGGNNSGSPRARLATVKTLPEAIAVVQEAFINRLKRILMIQAVEDVDPLFSLVELGADSIMAVDIRAWFLKELNVDVPVLKILGAGATIATLVEEAVGKIPKEILDLDNLQGKPESPPLTEYLSSSKVSSVPGTNSSPALLPSRSSPPETPDSEGSQILDTAERVMPIDWRKASVALPTEHSEQMTFGQNRFWFLSHYVEDPTTFNIAYMGKLTGRLRLDDLTSAVEKAAQRHETLRTRFFWADDDTKTPMQGILSKTLVRLETTTIECEDQAVQAYNEMSNYVWDLGGWIPLRMQLLVLSDTVQYLIMGSHHISMDGHSFNVLMLDINEAYNTPGQQLPPFPETSQARDFGAQQRKAHESGQLQPAIKHFRSLLPPDDLTRPIELLPFARTQVRPPLDHYSTHVARVRLESDVTSKLKQLARGHRATSFHAYLAAFQALLFRLLPPDTTDRLFIGMADANRLDSKFMGSIGNFLNVLPLRFDRLGTQTFGKAIEVARDSAYGALKHSGLPFDLLLDELEVPRSNAWAPVFQVFIDYRLVVREHADKRWAGCRIGDESWHASKSGYDVALEIVEDHEGAMLAVHVQKALYDEDGAELLVKSYANALTELTRRGESFNLEKLQRWDGEDVRIALDVGKGPEQQLVWPATVAHQIDEMITKYPNSVSIKDGDGLALTYAEMSDRVESIAHVLVPHIHETEEQAVVGVFQMPSSDWICSLLAIHRVGAIYLPLDLRNSIPRLASNVKAAQPTIILADSETLGRTREIGIDERVTVINVSKLVSKPSKRRIETVAKTDLPAYIIFTSGSTGEPKGIVVTHSGLRANLEGYHTAWNIDAVASVVLQNAAFSFDASLLQIYAALTTGGCLLVVPADARGDPVEVTRLMAEHQVTMTQATPSEYDMWFRFAPDNLRRCLAWKAAWFGGERAAPGVLEGFREACKVLPNLRVFTSYGPTEASISSMKGEANVRDPKLKVPVPGRLLPNYAAYIVDEEMQAVPIGVPGEIILGGEGVDRNEYLNRPDLTATHFLTDKFTKNPQPGWGRMYRTGDYGRLNTAGFLTVEGRIAGDTQVKLRGFRIELAEIERVIVQEAGGLLAHSVVTLRGDGEQDKFLAAHIVFEKGEQSETQGEIIAKLHARLPLCIPQYMCPAVIVALNEMPLTAHSKVDRRAVQSLPLPEIEKLDIKQYLDLTPTELRLADLWTEVLPQRAAGISLEPSSDFFRAGGNSLLLVKLQAGIKRAFGDAPRLSKLMSAVELGSMAALLDSGVSVVDWDKEMDLGSLNEVSVRAKGSNISKNLRILVTGATGSLGRIIIPQLLANEHVEQVICLVRETGDRDLTKLFPNIGKKLHIVVTDLPSLPMDTDFSQITTVLHCAADRNFFDGYNITKPINVDTAKVLAKMCLQFGIKLHVLSSGAVSKYEADDDNNCESLPRPSPADGYVSSKWVAERYLAIASRLLDLQVTAHRPTKTPKCALHDEETKIEAAVAQDMLLMSPKLGVRPDFSHLSGTIDVARLEDVASAVVSAVMLDKSSHQGMQIVSHAGIGQIRIEELAKLAEVLFERAENVAVKMLPSVPALHWVGLAKRAGIFEWLFTAQHLAVTDEEGEEW